MPSTVIASISYNAGAATLSITFVSGLVYDYKNVPAEIYKRLKAARSKGTFFNEHIKGRYAFEKMQQD